MSGVCVIIGLRNSGFATERIVNGGGIDIVFIIAMFKKRIC